jgi:hypothetical protein
MKQKQLNFLVQILFLKHTKALLSKTVKNCSTAFQFNPRLFLLGCSAATIYKYKSYKFSKNIGQQTYFGLGLLVMSLITKLPTIQKKQKYFYSFKVYRKHLTSWLGAAYS